MREGLLQMNYYLCEYNLYVNQKFEVPSLF